MAMDMDGWRDILHFDFYGEHVLFPTLRLSSGFNFLIASALTIFLCVLEKVLSYALSSKWNPLSSRHSRVGNATFRAGVYWILTLIRLLYMLLAMTFHVGLILVAVTTLSAGQFVIEYLETPHPYSQPRFSDGVPLLSSHPREFGGSSEEIGLPTTDALGRSLTASGYPPRLKRQAQKHSSSAEETNGTTIFAIDDGENTA